MDRFRRRVAAEHPEVVDTIALHEWSVRDPGGFWQHVWHDCGVVGDPGPIVFQPGAGGDVRTGRFFPEAQLSYAENVLAERAGANAEVLHHDAGEAVLGEHAPDRVLDEELGGPVTHLAVGFHLEAAGVAFTLSRSGRRALFCRDPDANALEFVESPEHRAAGD